MPALLLSGKSDGGMMPSPARIPMIDLIFIFVTLGFFILGALYARCCESL